VKKSIGIFAHVDAGKTTFSEQLLYNTKSIKARGTGITFKNKCHSDFLTTGNQSLIRAHI